MKKNFKKIKNTKAYLTVYFSIPKRTMSVPSSPGGWSAKVKGQTSVEQYNSSRIVGNFKLNLYCQFSNRIVGGTP